MSNFFEIDFLKVETAKSGDAIALRYELQGLTYIHVVDGGFTDTGDDLVAHIRQHYGNPAFINHVVLTHSDGDHAAGLKRVLEEFNVGTLWMHRPWLYTAELLPKFATINSASYLESVLRNAYPRVAELEEIALRRGFEIREPFQGAFIGAFTVLAPTKGRYLDLVASSTKTPAETVAPTVESAFDRIFKAVAAVVTLVRAAWGEEVFPTDGTSSENEMSVVQFANLCDNKILLTGDTGRDGLAEAIAYAPYAGLALPGIDRFQVPHHGSRRNVSTELLDTLLGERLPYQTGEKLFTAVISSAKADTAHPRKSVVRAMIHRGAHVVSTEGMTITTGMNAPSRDGWGPVPAMSYPEDQEAE